MHMSPVEHLFSSDEVLTNAESEIVHAILSDAAKELADIDAQLEETRANLARLSCVQDSLKSLMAHHRSLIAPIQLLPTEILSEIFILCLPMIGETPTETGALRAPLLLAQAGDGEASLCPLRSSGTRSF
ncbi:hypothetical protein BDQ12DRAFT_259301 [Crucibulum laeve]|uniref:Uncharacterized protein n=1 Tax=Crucibulum laeve TaxID=68775 RepID=A0A5C3LT65_9AGAR|nr:hypothetical protein BDQ12DRAFT_259301 [Crucibulum laeve]